MDMITEKKSRTVNWFSLIPTSSRCARLLLVNSVICIRLITHKKNTILSTIKNVHENIRFDPQTYMQIHIPTVVEGGGGCPPPTKSLLYVAVVRNDFTFSRKPLIFSTR